MIYIIAYDIVNNKQRAKVAKYLEKKGRRIQKSLFIVDIQSRHIKKLQKDLSNISDRKGLIHIFSLCNGCLKKAIFLGEEPPDCLIY